MGLRTYHGYFINQSSKGYILGHVNDLGKDAKQIDKVRKIAPTQGSTSTWADPILWGYYMLREVSEVARPTSTRLIRSKVCCEAIDLTYWRSWRNRFGDLTARFMSLPRKRGFGDPDDYQSFLTGIMDMSFLPTAWSILEERYHAGFSCYPVWAWHWSDHWLVILISYIRASVRIDCSGPKKVEYKLNSLSCGPSGRSVTYQLCFYRQLSSSSELSWSERPSLIVLEYRHFSNWHVSMFSLTSQQIIMLFENSVKPHTDLE